MENRVSVFEFTDGYYAVGLEGARRAFLPSKETMLDYLAHFPEHKVVYYKENITLEENFNVI